MARLAVFASGTGSNFAAIRDALVDSRHQLAYLVCDRPSALAVEKAFRFHIPVHLVPYAGRPRREAEQEIEVILRDNPVDVIALAGFMRVLSPGFVESRRERIVNIHPSLLPRYPGMRAIERSFDSEDEELGITVHFVDAGVDTGPTIAQASFPKSEVAGLAEAEARIHELEHEMYPRVVMDLLDEVDSVVRQEGV